MQIKWLIFHSTRAPQFLTYHRTWFSSGSKKLFFPSCKSNDWYFTPHEHPYFWLTIDQSSINILIRLKAGSISICNIVPRSLVQSSYYTHYPSLDKVYWTYSLTDVCLGPGTLCHFLPWRGRYRYSVSNVQCPWFLN